MRKSTHTWLLQTSWEKVGGDVQIKSILSWLPRMTGRRGGAISSFAVPVLCYHSWTIYGTAYNNNDHVALESDLTTLGRLGYNILPLTVLVEVLRGERDADTLANKKLVCLTFDDGTDYDYYDSSHEDWGVVPSFYSIVQRSERGLPQEAAGPRAVSFVIASPDARAVLDRTCIRGKGEWTDTWWKRSAESGLLGIANHSWDHVHEALDSVRQSGNLKGSFLAINTFNDAQAQIADAQRTIKTVAGKEALPFFGYPYGHVPSYLSEEYFPKYGREIGIHAAFTTAGTAVGPHSGIWEIPRLVCGQHWQSPSEFLDLLAAVEAGDL